MIKKAILAIFILLLGASVGLFVFKSEPKLNKNFENERSFFKHSPFRLGLDLSGGSHLVYKADVSNIPAGQIGESMDALRDVIERRINIFGVSEPVVQVQNASFISGGEEKLIVDLPGVTDVEKATAMIGQTPLLEFKIEIPKGEPIPVTVGKDGKVDLSLASQFKNTELTGRYLKKATLEFDTNTREPKVSLQFDDTGSKLFAQITKANV
ncbi:MAG: protein translocase subunit SecD, partial [Candidatus Paceibacterota bacterium]